MPWTDKERMPYDVLKNFEPQLLQHCVTEYHNPNNAWRGMPEYFRQSVGSGASRY
jgi:hypothetical protein